MKSGKNNFSVHWKLLHDLIVFLNPKKHGYVFEYQYRYQYDMTIYQFLEK